MRIVRDGLPVLRRYVFSRYSFPELRHPARTGILQGQPTVFNIDEDNVSKTQRLVKKYRDTEFGTLLVKTLDLFQHDDDLLIKGQVLSSKELPIPIDKAFLKIVNKDKYALDLQTKEYKPKSIMGRMAAVKGYLRNLGLRFNSEDYKQWFASSK